MRTGFTIPAGGSGAQSVKMEVFRYAFEDLMSEDEFLNFLVDHEYVHVRSLTGRTEITAPLEVHREFPTRVFSVRGDLHVAFQELEAYSHQIKAFPQRPTLRESFKNMIVESYRLHRSLVVENKEQTPLTRWLLERYPDLPNG